MELLDLFPKTIAVATLETLTPEVIDRAIEFIEISHSEGMSGDGSYTTEQQILDKAIFREVKQEIIRLCLQFSQAYSHVVKEIGICNSWGNCVDYSESIRYHRHNNSYISGSFYLNRGASFKILNVAQDELFGFMPEVKGGADNFRSWDSFTIDPEPGRVVLFPSGLYHCVLPSQSHEKRYSIAFNAVPLGKVGSPTGLINLQLS